MSRSDHGVTDVTVSCSDVRVVRAECTSHTDDVSRSAAGDDVERAVASTCCAVVGLASVVLDDCRSTAHAAVRHHTTVVHDLQSAARPRPTTAGIMSPSHHHTRARPTEQAASVTQRDNRLAHHFGLLSGLGLLMGYLATSSAKSDVIFLLGDPDFLLGRGNFAPISLSFRDLMQDRQTTDAATETECSDTKWTSLTGLVDL